MGVLNLGLCLDLEKFHGVAALDQMSLFGTQVADAIDQLDRLVFSHIEWVIGAQENTLCTIAVNEIAQDL